MATFNQFEANRLNAQKSTGPRTPAGKEASRFNALQHGIDARHTIIPGENQADLERLANEYQDQLRPETPVERYLVDTLISSDWLRRRLHRAQADLYHVLAVRAGGFPHPIPRKRGDLGSFRQFRISPPSPSGPCPTYRTAPPPRQFPAPLDASRTANPSRYGAGSK